MDVPLPKPCTPDFQKANKRIFDRMCKVRGVDPATQTASPILQKLIKDYKYYEKEVNLWDHGEDLEQVIRRKGWVK